MTDQPSQDDYEISILDILVVLAENLRLIILVPLIVGLIALGVTYLIPKTYQSTALLRTNDGVQGVQGVQGGPVDFTSVDVLEQILKQQPEITTQGLSHEKTLQALFKRIQVTAKKQDSYITVAAQGSTPEKSQLLCRQVIESFRNFSLPHGQQLDAIKEEIKNTEDSIRDLSLVAKKISTNMDKVTPGTEGDNVARAYVTIIEKLNFQKQNLFKLKQRLVGFGAEVFIQEPTLPEKPIKPKKAQIAIMATLAAGFLTILFVFVRAAFRNLSGDAESSEKLARIRKGIGLR
jgi:LPS O-antigen subunit length determinant protein (WzzB/FepE family)